MSRYDSILLLSFGGPESEADVIPFLENVLRGKNVPRERMLEVAEHYYHFGGKSPINEQNREMLAALRAGLDAASVDLPLYWGNRNWHPLLPDTLRRMAADGRKSALAYVTSAFGSYSGCRQYREDIVRAREEVGDEAPEVYKIRPFWEQHGFLDAMADRVRDGFKQVSEDHRDSALLLFTAHSVPISMARSSPYVGQLEEACRLVAEAAGRERWRLVYQSRSGPPGQPWLEPDVCDELRRIRETEEAPAVVVSPIGFLSDHMEVLFDLDTEARELCDEIGLEMVRSGTVGAHPKFVRGIVELIQERLADSSPGPTCPLDCCPRPQRPKARPAA